MDSHAPRMSYRADLTANRLITARQVDHAQAIHKQKLVRIARRKRQFKAYEPPNRHLRQNLKRKQLEAGWSRSGSLVRVVRNLLELV